MASEATRNGARFISGLLHPQLERHFAIVNHTVSFREWLVSNRTSATWELKFVGSTGGVRKATLSLTDQRDKKQAHGAFQNKHLQNENRQCSRRIIILPADCQCNLDILPLPHFRGSGSRKQKTSRRFKNQNRGL